MYKNPALVIRLRDTETNWAKQALTYNAISASHWLRQTQFSSVSFQFYQYRSWQLKLAAFLYLYCVQMKIHSKRQLNGKLETAVRETPIGLCILKFMQLINGLSPVVKSLGKATR